MRRHVKYFFLMIPLFVMVALFLNLQSPAVDLDRGLEEEDVELVEMRKQIGADSSLVTDVHLVQYDGKKTKWTMTAPRAERLKSGLIVVKKPQLNIYRDSVGPRWVVTAQEGEIGSHARTMLFNREVNVFGSNQRLSTEQLRFNPAERMLSTDQAFKMQDGSWRLEGVGMNLDQDLRQLTVRKRVKLTMPEGSTGDI
ncbi:MAG: LPS export ABC transporter periplasmic protein LptC [Magnetococcales bacterium]|nr:LPS export ABC transporter periplasmic protein LptC [Magnetococcales bacterium]